jgi:hypothetical protein
MISYRQADLRDKLRNPNGSNVFNVTFKYDEGATDFKFYYNSIDHMEGEDPGSTKWNYLHDTIVRIVKEERATYSQMSMRADVNIGTAFEMVNTIIDRLKALTPIISAKKISQETEDEPTPEHQNIPYIIKYKVQVVL